MTSLTSVTTATAATAVPAAPPGLTPLGAATTSGTLSGVAATSASRAWAVGAGTHARTLILGWNGTSWTRMASPGGRLSGVAAVSASDAWSVGCEHCSGAGDSEPLILHWNGATWAKVPSPAPGSGGQLNGVAADSARDAWAVGSTSTGTPLIERWNGTTWKRVPSPGPAHGELLGVSASSPRSAWAVGSTGNGHTLILRWNGTAWKRTASPSFGPRHGLFDQLAGVSASSARQAWAVGNSGCGCGPGSSLILRWNGNSWRRVPSPTTPLGGISLTSVAAVSARSAWAVGLLGSGDGPAKTVIARWDGSSWQQVPSPSPRGSAELSGLTVNGTHGTWAVGSTSTRNHTAFRSLILAWNGTAWK